MLVNNPAADTGSNDTQSETTLVLAGSTVVVAYNDSGSNASNNKFTGFAQSTDGGATFTDKGTLPTNSAGDAGDPALARDNVSGTIYFATLGYSSSNVIQVFRSTDNGATFCARVNAAPGFASGHQLDKEWIAVDNAAGAGQGTVYVVFTDFPNIFTDNGVYLTRSTDGGNTWSSPLSLGGSQGGYVTVGPDHTVYAFTFNQGSPETIQMRKSTNQGATFGPAVTVATLATTGTNGDLGLKVSNTNSTSFRSSAFPQAAVTANGIYVAFDDRGTTAGDKGDIFLARSSDGGATWTKTKLNDDATTRDQWQPALAVTPDGNHVGVFWYDRRNDPNNGNIDRYGVIGNVSGSSLTFGSNFRITDASFPAVVGQDPLINTTYMGDYDVAVADNGAFYTTWSDNRLSDSAHANQPDVRFAKIPLAGTTHFSVSTSPSSSKAGNAFSVTVSALDANNNVDPTYRGTVRFTTSDGGSGVALPADYAFTGVDNGVHIFNGGATLVTAGNQTVTATDTANGSVNGAATETITAAAATHLAVAAPANATAGTAFSVTVTAQDPYNNTATGYRGTVSLTSPTDSAASMPPAYAFAAVDNGVHTFNGVTLNTTGNQTVTATDGATASINGSATVNVSTLIQATKLILHAVGDLDDGGQRLQHHRDRPGRQRQHGRRLPGHGPLHQHGHPLGGRPAGGLHLHGGRQRRAHLHQRREARDGGQPGSDRDRHGDRLDHRERVGDGQPGRRHAPRPRRARAARVNVAFTVTVTALDAYNNTATGYRGTVQFSSSLRKTKLPSHYAFTAADNGVHTFTNGVTFTQTGTATLQVNDRSNHSIAASASISVTTSPLAGPGSPLDADGGLDEILAEILDGNPQLDQGSGLSIGIVLQELRDEGFLDAYFASQKNRSHGQLVAQLKDEIETFLAGDVAFSDFAWQ